MSTQQEQVGATVAPALTEERVKAMLGEILARTEASARDARETEVFGRVKFTADGLEASDLAGLWRLAGMYSRSTIVPEQYQGKPENCLIALQMASRCRMDAFAFMQSSYIVHGRPGIEGKLVIAMLNASGKIKGRVRYVFDGDGKKKSCTAMVTDKETGEEISLKLDWATVEAEGWCLDKPTKSGGVVKSKWNTLTDQMFRYRSATFLVRSHYPEVMMGLQTTDELDDAWPSDRQEAPVPPNGRISLTDRGNGATLPPTDGAATDAHAEEKRQTQAPTSPEREPGDEKEDSEPAPMDNDQSMLIADEMQRVGKDQVWLSERCKAVGKRFQKLSYLEADGVIAELVDLPSKGEEPATAPTSRRKP